MVAYEQLSDSRCPNIFDCSLSNSYIFISSLPLADVYIVNIVGVRFKLHRYLNEAWAFLFEQIDVSLNYFPVYLSFLALNLAHRVYSKKITVV